MEEATSKRWLLISDLDGTLTGDDGGAAAMTKLGIRVTLVLNSSRPRHSVLRTLEDLPKDLRVAGLITAMGTEIMLHGLDMPNWPERFASWDRRPVDELMERHGILPHRPEFQARYKASYHAPADRWHDLRSRVLRVAPESQIVTSGESDFDVLPAAAGKRNAASWVARTMGFPSSRIVVAGDSGNDLDMFAGARMAIAVANSRAELTEKADPATTYFADQPHARGVIEGLRHWGALPPVEQEEEAP